MRQSLRLTLILLAALFLSFADLGCSGVGSSAAPPGGSGGSGSGSSNGGSGSSSSSGSMASVNHIVFMLQENRSFDSYFGKLNDYRVKNGFGGASDVDGLPAGVTNPADPTADLSWSSTNATSVTIDNGVPASGASGTFRVMPASTTTYTATASNATGSAKASIVVGVAGGGGASIQIGASPLQIAPGEKALLTWGASGATAVSISGILGNFGPLGETPVSPAATTTYTATAFNGATAVGTASVTVTVAAPPPGAPTISFSVSPFNISTPATSSIANFKLRTTCIEDLSPDWLESHAIVNRDQPANTSVLLMNGYVHVAAGFAQYANSQGDKHHFFDVVGARGMGYYTENELLYYYFIASQFATADRWFSPMPTNTFPNRVATFAATTAGHAHIFQTSLSVPTIWDRLEAAGISWKIYYANTDPNSGRPITTLWVFQPFGDAHASHVVPLDQYFSDVANGTLPAVSFIETGFDTGQDEHPGNNVQTGALFTAKIVNALMASPSWKDAVFFLTFDEGGAAYDHVPPAAAVSPDGIKPMDLLPKDPPGDFTITGFRTPTMVISPFTRQHYVSHTVVDHTAILKFIEKRFNLQPLNARDAAQADISEFFDFAGAPWKTPPTPPVQPFDDSVCYFDRLP